MNERKMKINKGYFATYFKECSYNLEDQFISNLDLYLNILHKKYPASWDKWQMPNEDVIELAKLRAREFCNKHKIPKSSIGDFVMINYIISISARGKELHSRTSKLMRASNKLNQQLEALFKNFNPYTDFKSRDFVRGIKIIGKRKEDDIVIKNQGDINQILEALRKFRFRFYPHMVKVATMHDVKVFSWAILNYLNQFTQYKAPKGKLVTDEQCRMIHEILSDARLIKQHTDEEDYIRAYLKQASAMLS